MSKVRFSKWHQESIKKMLCASYEPMGVALVEPARDWLILVFGQAVTSCKRKSKLDYVPGLIYGLIQV
ncbi:unnamed protein product [Brassica oleracea var. botrytis]